jgi:hypothetical protein
LHRMLPVRCGDRVGLASTSAASIRR